MKKKVSVILMVVFVAAFAFSDVDIKQVLNSYGESKGLFLWWHSEGNFTNSGKKEVVGLFKAISDDEIFFYKDRPEEEKRQRKEIKNIFCFVLDEDKIVEVYKIPLLDFLDVETERMPFGSFPELGEKSPYGWIGDFNKTGRDQLFFYSMSGCESYPVVFEFWDGEFKLILDCSEGRKSTLTKNDFIDGASAKDKTIYITECYNDYGVYLKTSYVWNDAQRRFINTEADIPYRVNQKTGKMEEITGPFTNRIGTFTWNRETHYLEPVE